MPTAVVTGSAGLIGTATVRRLTNDGWDVIGIDNDMRAYFFGPEASTKWSTERLLSIPTFHHRTLDIRDWDGVSRLFRMHGKFDLVVHTAAQPSHDWAAREPLTDFGVNATGTLHMLEAARQYCPDAPFIHISTSKVYGDAPNELPFVELATRYDLPESLGIDESFRIDQSKHSLFGASKLSGDVMAQEYGRYFDMPVGIFRPGCLTGPDHSGTELHGFLAYLVKCTLTGDPYTVYGYKGKQVRCNIHADDLVNSFVHFAADPKPGEVYNIGGGRFSNCSMLEAIELIQRLTGKQLNYTVSSAARIGDHIWWISDCSKFERDYPEWSYQYSLEDTVQQMIEQIGERV